MAKDIQKLREDIILAFRKIKESKELPEAILDIFEDLQTELVVMISDIKADQISDSYYDEDNY